MRVQAQRRALLAACEPLRRLGAHICEGELSGKWHVCCSSLYCKCSCRCYNARGSGLVDTHYFARANEPKVPQQVVVAAGRLGLDLPGVFDVVATNMQVLDRHHWTIASSDHDCVAATVRGQDRGREV
jgi:hypothetical protein